MPKLSRNQAVKLIEELLELYATKNYDEVNRVILYQRGYLTGILADLIRNDFNAEYHIRKKINQRKK